MTFRHFPNFLRSEVLSHSTTREATRIYVEVIMFRSNNRTSLHLW